MQTLTRAALCFVLILTASIALAQSNYQIRPGDQISIEVLEDSNLNRTVTVLPDGQFSFPFAGSLRAAGRTVSQVQESITSAIAPNFATTPTVFVSVSPAFTEPAQAPPAATIDIYFLGEVNSPGEAQMPPGTTFLQALARSGGLTRFAAEKRIQLRRGTQVIEVDYRALSRGARLSSDIVLQDGDVILAPGRRLFE